MTPAQFALYVRKKTKTDATTYPDELLLIHANIAKNEICEAVVDTDEGYFDMELTRNLEVGKRNYTLDASIMNGIKYVEGMLDGENQKHLIPYNLHKLKVATNEASIVSFMAGQRWGYFLSGNQIYVLNDAAIVPVTDGLKMWASVYPLDLDDLSSTVDMSEPPNGSDIEFGVPIALHELMARRTIIEYKTSQEKPIALTEKEQKFDVDLLQKIRQMTGLNTDEAVTPSSSNDDGSDY